RSAAQGIAYPTDKLLEEIVVSAEHTLGRAGYRPSTRSAADCNPAPPSPIERALEVSAEHTLGRGLQRFAPATPAGRHSSRAPCVSAEHTLGRGLQPETPEDELPDIEYRPSTRSAADCNARSSATIRWRYGVSAEHTLGRGLQRPLLVLPQGIEGAHIR